MRTSAELKEVGEKVWSRTTEAIVWASFAKQTELRRDDGGKRRSERSGSNVIETGIVANVIYAAKEEAGEVRGRTAAVGDPRWCL